VWDFRRDGETGGVAERKKGPSYGKPAIAVSGFHLGGGTPASPQGIRESHREETSYSDSLSGTSAGPNENELSQVEFFSAS